MKTFKLHLIRHGLTAGNLQGLYIGSGTDIPLCDEGRAQLAELKERFEYPQVDTVFSSPLMRAVETANILFPNATHQFSVHDLREAGFGVFENHPVKELVKNEDFKNWITPGSGFVPVGASYLHSRDVSTLNELYSLDSGVTARCGGQSIPCGSFAAPLYAENAADASAFTLNLAAGRGAMLHCFCAVPGEWETLELSYRPAFAAGQPVEFVVRRDADAVRLGPVPAAPGEVGSVVDL